MHDLDKTKQFIELRSKRLSFDAIAKTLNVSKHTLIKWDKMFEKEISTLEKIRVNEIKETLLLGKQHRLEMLSAILGEIKTEIKEQPVLLSYERLVKLSLKIFQQLDKEEYYDFKRELLVNKNLNSEEEPELVVETNENQ